MKLKQDGIVYMLFKVIKVSVDNIMLPTGKNLFPALKFSLIIFASSFIGSLIGVYTFISWQGALIAVIVLSGLCYMERSEYDAVSRVYGNTKLRLERLKRKSKGTSSSIKTERSDDSSNENIRETGDGSDTTI